jgi:hypothetical protein
MLRRRIMVAAGSVVLVATGTMGISAASAAPKPPAGMHQHWGETATGTWVRVGPNACENGVNQAFSNFHWNGHKGMPGDAKLERIIGTGCSGNPNIPS